MNRLFKTIFVMNCDSWIREEDDDLLALWLEDAIRDEYGFKDIYNEVEHHYDEWLGLAIEILLERIER